MKNDLKLQPLIGQAVLPAGVGHIHASDRRALGVGHDEGESLAIEDGSGVVVRAPAPSHEEPAAGGARDLERGDVSHAGDVVDQDLQEVRVPLDVELDAAGFHARHSDVLHIHESHTAGRDGGEGGLREVEVLLGGVAHAAEASLRAQIGGCHRDWARVAARIPRARDLEASSAHEPIAEESGTQSRGH